jgi:hypothetical protein
MSAGEMAVQLQPKAASGPSEPKMTVLSWKFVTVEEVEKVEWTVECAGMNHSKYCYLYLYYLDRTKVGDVLLDNPCDGQHTFCAVINPKLDNENRHSWVFR